MQATIAAIKRRNVILMGICFMLMFTAYNPSQNYALALLGNHAYFVLAVIYLVMAISNFFASAAVKKVGSLKLAMTISGYTYSAYLLAIAVYLATDNTIFIVYIFSVIIGIGAGILWSAQGSSLTENSDPKARGASSGLFFSIMSVCNITGNLLSFLMFYFGFQPLILFILLAVLCAIGCSGLLLLKKIEDHWVSLSDVEDGINEDKAPQEDESIKNVNADAQSVTSDGSAATVSTASSTKTSEENNHVELEEEIKHGETKDVINMDEKKTSQTEGASSLWQEIWQSISMVSAPELLAQMGVFFFSAVYSTYINGPFTAFFKDDRMQVGGIFAVNGVGKILFTYLGGKLKDRLSSQGFLKILTGIMAALMIVYFALQFMQDEIMDADRTTRYAIFYVIGFFAAFDGILNIYLYAYLGKLYPKGVVSIQAIAVFKFIQSMSSALAFFYARFLNGMVQVIIMIVVLGATFPIAIKFNKDKGKIS